mgnify:FL=1
MNKILNDKLYSKIIKTFFEGFLSALIVTIPSINNLNNIDLIKSILIGSVAMGISAVLNLLQEYLNGKSNS